MMKKENIVLVAFFILAILFSTFFIMAVYTPAAPSNLYFGLNTSSYYDGDGIISLNWTAGNPANWTANFTIWVSVDGGLNYFRAIKNDSATGVIYTNNTDANYTFIVQRVNKTAPGASALNSSNISIIMDIYPPATITIHSFGNKSNSSNKAYAASSQVALNVLVADANSTSAIHTCEFNINGTNESVAAVNNWCNSTTLNLTGLTDGTRMIKIYANDSAGHGLLNNTGVYIEIDSTNPSASPSCDPSTINSGDSFPCSCGGSDTGGSGINTTKTSYSSSSDDGTSTPSLTGTFTYTCTVYDYAGNTASTTATYIVKNPGSSPPGGTTSGPTKKIQSWTKISPGEATIMKNIDGDAGIKQIQVEVKEEANNVKVTVSKYNNKPAAVSVEKTGKIYRYLQIETQNLEDKLDKAIVTIQVEKTWLSNNGLDKDNVALFKFDEDNQNWNELTTTYKNEDSTYYYYDVELTSFSYFAISSKAMEGEEEPGTIGGTPEETEKVNLTWLWIIIGVVVLAAIIGGGIAVKRKAQQ